MQSFWVAHTLLRIARCRSVGAYDVETRFPSVVAPRPKSIRPSPLADPTDIFDRLSLSPSSASEDDGIDLTDRRHSIPASVVGTGIKPAMRSFPAFPPTLKRSFTSDALARAVWQPMTASNPDASPSDSTEDEAEYMDEDDRNMDTE